MSRKKNKNHSLWLQPYKLICPSINQKLIARERLLNLLDQSKYLPLTCVFSPAGYGKSTLVADWLQSRQYQHGWYSLDSNDNEPSFFANHLIYALHNASQGGCPETLALAQQLEYANLSSLLSKAMMEIAQTLVPFFMVFDDVHLLTNNTIIGAINQWLKHLPAHVHIILCGRDEPVLPLSSFRVKGQLLEIGAAELAFNATETKAFLKQSLSFDISEAMSAELTEKTGGWPAAMQLISHSARSESDLIDASGRFGFGAYEVDEFLIHEVLSNQPEKIKQYLLQICVFEQFNAPLCHSLVPDLDSHAMLFELEQRQLFITRVESQQRWYRLQDIFRNCLLSQLDQQTERYRMTLYCHAVTAYLDNGFAVEAVQMGLTQKNKPVTKAILSGIGMELYRNGQFNTLSKLYDCLTLDDIRDDPKLTLLYSWVLLATYRESDVNTLLSEPQKQNPESLPTQTQAELAIAQAQAAINIEDFDRAHMLAKQAMALLSPDSFVSRTVTYSVLGQSALCRGDLPAALELLNETEQLAFEFRLVQQRLWSMCLISDTYTAMGELDTALAVQQDAIDMAHDNCIEDVLHMEFLYRNRTRLLIEQGDLSQAEQLFLKSEQIIEPLGNYGLLNIHVHRGQVALWRGRNNDVRKLAFQVNYLLQNFDFHSDWLAYANEFLLACQSAEQLNFEPHLIWLDYQLDVRANNHFYQHYQRTYAIQRYLHGSQLDAIDRLKKLTAISTQHDLKLQTLKNQIQLALWLNDDEGLSYWQTLLPQLKKLKTLQSLWLSSLFTNDIGWRDWPEWDIWFSQAKTITTNHRQEDLLKNLNDMFIDSPDLVTPKELQVLLLIGNGLNNDEIASSMHIAVSTVKSHIRRLYRKLNITKRSQAINICRHL